MTTPCLAFIIFSLLTGCLLVHGLKYDKTFNVQPQPIQFLEEPTDHVTLAGADVTFVCSTAMFMSKDFSIPHTTWHHNNSIVRLDHHYIISHNGSYSTLTVKNVTSDDQGVYHCTVNDWKIKIRSRYGHLNVVESRNQIAFINATLGSTVILPCLTLSSTKPTWLKDKEEKLDYKPNQLLLEDGTLKISNINEDSSGHYQCLVNESNVIRIESFHITVQKFSKKSAIIGLQSTSSSQYLLIIPDNCDNSPHDQRITLQCPVTGYPSPVISWYLNGKLVNITDFNITDNIENNTWIIQGGDPCELIGYWQCFATNEAGTVHNEIRVLPYGWSTLPRAPALKATEVVQQNDKVATVSYMISWQPPLYLGGLSLNDIKYMVTVINNNKNIGSTIVNDTYFRIPLTVHVKTTLLKTLEIRVYTISTQINSKYLPANVPTEAIYNENDLIKIAINFLPPLLNVNCLTSGNALLHWSVRSSGNLSSNYINTFVKSWAFTGSCKNQQGDVHQSTKYSGETIGGTTKEGEGNHIFYNLSNGTICNYTAFYVYMRNLTMSPGSSAYCTVIRDDVKDITETVNVTQSYSSQINISSSDMSSVVRPTPSIIITEVSETVLYTSSQINSIYSSKPSASSDVPNLTVTKTESTQKSVSTFSSLNFTTATHSTHNIEITISSPPLHNNDSNKGTSPGLLGTVFGLLLLLIVSAVVCGAAVVLYQHKRSRHNKEDYKFLKFSQYLKNIKSPLSNNYCSTINIADESVCEMPVNKVMKWIDNNDFQHSTNMLQQSNSFDSLATSEMIAYICKEGKNGDRKWFSGHCDEGDNVQLKKLAFVDNISCSQLSTSSIPSHYLCEDSHRNKTLSSSSETTCDHDSQCNSEVFTLSEDSSLPLQTKNWIKRKPTDLFISEKSTNMPLFTPKVTNPIFADTSSSTLADPLTSSSLLHSPIETDLLNDILQTLPHTTDNDVLSQLSGIPSHYLYEGNRCNKITFSSSDSDDDPANPHDDTTNDNILQCTDEVFLSQSTGDIDYDVLVSDNSSHVNNRKPPTNLSVLKQSASVSLFTPQVINPLFVVNTNLSSTDTNSLTSESSLLPQLYNEKDTLQSMLHSHLHEMNDGKFSQDSNNSDMPSHYLYEGNCCNGKTITPSASLNEFDHSQSDKTDDSGCEIVDNFSPQNSDISVSLKSNLHISKKSVSPPVITPKPITIDSATPVDSGIYTSLLQSSSKSDSPSPEFSTMCCKQMDSDMASSHLSISSTISSHYMHEGVVFNAKTLSHYFDDNAAGQINYKIDADNSPQTNKSCQGALFNLSANETSDKNVHVVSPNSILSCHELNANYPLTVSENYKIPTEDLNLDTISQFSYSDTNSELNACADSDYDDFTFGYSYV